VKGPLRSEGGLLTELCSVAPCCSVVGRPAIECCSPFRNAKLMAPSGRSAKETNFVIVVCDAVG
jgi:hypothetical protein